jgi:hypothetical protein
MREQFAKCATRLKLQQIANDAFCGYKSSRVKAQMETKQPKAFFAKQKIGIRILYCAMQ